MKRFYTSVKENFAEGGWHIGLDCKSVRTPLKKILLLPNQRLAQLVAREWAAQGEIIDKNTMPLTGYAAVANDIVPTQRAALMDEIIAYAQTDLLCYRSEDEKLAPRQAAIYDPLIAQLAEIYGLKLNVTQGVMPVAQPEANQEIIRMYAGALDDFQLAGLMVAMKTLSSLFLAMLFKDGHIDGAFALRASRFDETAQAERWGVTDTFEQKQAALTREIAALAEFFSACKAAN